MFKPPILILDEPTVGLDPISSLKLKKLARQMADNGATILLVSHIMIEMEQLIDRMIFMLDGEVNFNGSISELMQKAKGIRP